MCCRITLVEIFVLKHVEHTIAGLSEHKWRSSARVSYWFVNITVSWKRIKTTSMRRCIHFFLSQINKQHFLVAGHLFLLHLLILLSLPPPAQSQSHHQLHLLLPKDMEGETVQHMTCWCKQLNRRDSKLQNPTYLCGASYIPGELMWAQYHWQINSDNNQVSLLCSL